MKEQTSLVKFYNKWNLIQLLEDTFCPSTESVYQLQQQKNKKKQQYKKTSPPL